MEGAERAALRVALAFAAALTLIEAMDVEVGFIAPLVAVMLSAAPVSLGLLLAAPFIIALMVTLVALLVEGLATMPFVLLLVLFGLFVLGFRLSARPGVATIGLLVLVACAALPDVLLAQGEATDELVSIVFRNVAVAVGCTLAAGWLVGGPPIFAPRARVPQPLPALGASAVLMLAVLLVWTYEPRAAGPLLLSVIITLRADGEPAVQIIPDRLLGAVLGGTAALVVSTMSTISTTLPVLATASLACAFPLALLAARRGAWSGVGFKGLTAMAILTGQGLSLVYEDTADQFWTRFGGVILGLGFVVAMLLLAAGRRALVRPGDG
jgi:hypothetical protein